jgi:hypothetical protein
MRSSNYEYKSILYVYFPPGMKKKQLLSAGSKSEKGEMRHDRHPVKNVAPINSRSMTVYCVILLYPRSVAARINKDRVHHRGGKPGSKRRQMGYWDTN